MNANTLAEVFERAQICDDDKARRVLNVSSQRADITADEIESGVTLERLQRLNVPVFRYSTQVTIHGNLPDFNPESRPLGYKAIFRNGNGSLGVKYVAIDGDKKRLICQASQLSDRKPKFSACLNSAGLELVYGTRDRQTAIDTFQSFPRQLIIGGLYAARGLYGEFYVVANVGAIESGNLWPLIQFLYGFADQTALDAAQLASDQADQARHAAWDARHKEESAQLEIKLTAQKAELLAMLQANHSQLGALPPGECCFVRLVKDYSEMKLQVYALRNRAGSLCYTRKDYSDETKRGFEPDRFQRMKRFDAAMLNLMIKAIQAGYVFAVQS